MAVDRLHGLRLPDDLEARAFRDPAAVERRRELLDLCPTHMVKLKSYVEELRRQRPDWEVPDFDPIGGGVEARALFLFEKPGPMTAKRGGSGFLSVQNDDPTAAATQRFITHNRIPLDWCLFANVIPWWDGTRKISREQRDLSGKAISVLLEMLPDLRAIVLVGQTAQRAWRRCAIQPSPSAKVWSSDHTSPLVRARHPQRWNAIPSHWPDRESLEDKAVSRPVV